MDFEYTSSIHVDDAEFAEMMEDMAERGLSAEDAAEAWASCQDDTVYSEIGYVFDDIVAELEKRWVEAHNRPKPQPPVDYNLSDMILHVIKTCSCKDECFFDICPLSAVCVALVAEE